MRFELQNFSSSAIVFAFSLLLERIAQVFAVNYVTTVVEKYNFSIEGQIQGQF
jgi:hypothetical protein